MNVLVETKDQDGNPLFVVVRSDQAALMAELNPQPKQEKEDEDDSSSSSSSSSSERTSAS